MKQIEKISEGVNYAGISVGSFGALGEHFFSHPMGIEVPGRVFLRDALSLSGCEVSFQLTPAGGDTGFIHTHKKNEELYVVIRGRGEFRVNDTVFAIEEGSAVRVAPGGRRSYRNNGTEDLVMMCIQSKAGSLEETTFEDGVRLDEPLKW